MRRIGWLRVCQRFDLALGDGRRILAAGLFFAGEFIIEDTRSAANAVWNVFDYDHCPHSAAEVARHSPTPGGVTNVLPSHNQITGTAPHP